MQNVDLYRETHGNVWKCCCTDVWNVIGHDSLQVTASGDVCSSWMCVCVCAHTRGINRRAGCEWQLNKWATDPSIMSFDFSFPKLICCIFSFSVSPSVWNGALLYCWTVEGIVCSVYFYSWIFRKIWMRQVFQIKLNAFLVDMDQEVVGKTYMWLVQYLLSFFFLLELKAFSQVSGLTLYCTVC